MKKSMSKKRQLYLIQYNNCYGQGYYDMDGSWNDGTSIEGKTTSPDYWLKRHNKERVGLQATAIQWELFVNCKTLEEAIKYGMDKLGLSKDDAENEWEEVISFQECKEEFDFIAI